MCIGFGERRGECTNEAVYFPDGTGILEEDHFAGGTGIGWCLTCKAEYERRDRAAEQAQHQRQHDIQQGLVTVWE